MLKQILKNQQGMSLVEVIVASAVSIIIAMGVVQINESSQKGMQKIQADADFVQFRNTMKVRLGTQARCGPTQINGSGATLNTLNISSNVDLNRLHTSSSNSGPEIVKEQAIPMAPNWVAKTITMSALSGNSNTTIGDCSITIEVERRNKKEGSVLGRKTRTMILPVVCEVDDVSTKRITGCASSIDKTANDGAWKIKDNNNTGDKLEFAGTGGEPKVEIVGVATSSWTDPTRSAALSLDPGSTITLGGGVRHALAIPQDAAITFGDNDEIKMVGTGSSMLEMNGSMTIGQSLTVNQHVTSNNYYYSSDRRYKERIETIKDASQSISELRGVTYFMRRDEFPEMNFESDKQIGLIAQEVEAIFPELVQTHPETGYKSVQYGNVVAILIEAVKEQIEEIKTNKQMLSTMQVGIQLKNVEQDSRIDKLEQENKELREELKDLRKQIDLINQKVNQIIINKED